MGRLRHARDLRARHLDRRRPVALPRPAARLGPTPDGSAEGEPPGIPAHVRLGKEHESRALAADLLRHRAYPVDGDVPVEGRRGRLDHHRNANGCRLGQVPLLLLRSTTSHAEVTSVATAMAFHENRTYVQPTRMGSAITHPE